MRALGDGRQYGTGKEGPGSGLSAGGREPRPTEKRTLLAMEHRTERDWCATVHAVCLWECACVRDGVELTPEEEGLGLRAGEWAGVWRGGLH